VEFHYRNERFNHMKKVLIGFAAAAVAVVGIGTTASAGATTDTIYDVLLDEVAGQNGSDFEDFLEAAGLDDKFDSCGAPFYTVFFPYSYDGVLNAAANALGYVDAIAALENAPDLIKGLLGYHVVAGVYAYDTLEQNLFTNLTNSVGGSLTIEGDGSTFTVNGAALADSHVACNGVVYEIYGLLKPATPGSPSCGANVVGACTPAGGSGSGSGLPKTGSESMALTYAALASLIAGAGVLVIRRRSIA
jgi:LPXTG-motif cell wall-anchored protein